MTNTLKDRVALVTGSSSGIGKGIAQALASRGCSVVLSGLATDAEVQDLLREFQAQYKAAFHFVHGNFLEIESTEKFCQDVLAIYPDGVDILVNNAGVPGRGALESLSNQVWVQTLAVNLTAPFVLTRAFFPLMKRKGWGRIINMSSQMGLIADPGKSAYCATKAGLIGFTRVVALEGAQYGITCNAVCPGYADAPLGHSLIAKDAELKNITFEESKAEFARQRLPTGRLVTIAEIAELVAFLSSDSASSISGTPIPIDGANMAR